MCVLYCNLKRMAHFFKTYIVDVIMVVLHGIVEVMTQSLAYIIDQIGCLGSVSSIAAHFPCSLCTVSTYNSTCSAPNVGGHASISPPLSTSASSLYQIGDTVTYVCEDKYILEGVATRVCLGGNRWSGVRPRCVKKSTDYELEE